MIPPKEPVTVTVGNVLNMIRAHKEGDEKAFEKAALLVATELMTFDNEELALYIYVQYGLVDTWVPQ